MRTTLERGSKPGKLRGRSDGVRFDAAVAQIAHVAPEIQALGFALGEKAEAHALHKSGDKEALCLFRVRHKLQNCSRDARSIPNGRCHAVPGDKLRKLEVCVAICGKLLRLRQVQAGRGCFGRLARILILMDRDVFGRFCRAISPIVGAVCLTAALLAGACGVAAQESQAPMTPPPADHDVRRIGNTPEPAEPPSLPPEEIIKKFAAKEDEYVAARPTYSSRRTVRIDEFDRQGKLSGQFLMVTEVIRAPDGRIVNKVVEHPQSTLHAFPLEPEDVKELERIPQFPLNSGQLAKYDLKYIGQETIDEIDTYIFKVTPRALDRVHAYLDGIVWVDTKYLEVVKTYGRWVNELGEVKFATMPFTTFETYRENVDGKYWFPNYERADETLHLKDGDFPVRLVIKWSDFKPLPATVSAPDAAPAAAPSAPATPPPKPQS
jgi:hypothetical protein